MVDSAGVYRITNTVNGKVYVGSSVNVKKRLKQHVRALVRKDHGNSYLQRAWVKHGADAFVFEPLLICSIEQVLFYEQLLIDGFDATNRKKGYNNRPTAGNNLGATHSVEAKLKMSEAKKGKTFSAEHSAKIGIANKGQTRSLVSKAAMSAWQIGVAKSPEHIEKMRAAAIARWARKAEREAQSERTKSYHQKTLLKENGD